LSFGGVRAERSEVFPDPGQHGRGQDRCEGDKERCDHVMDHAAILARPVIVGRGSAHPIDEMNSDAGRTLQLDVFQFVVSRDGFVKPSLHLLRISDAVIDL
jgi:hypothetical protein